MLSLENFLSRVIVRETDRICECGARMGEFLPENLSRRFYELSKYYVCRGSYTHEIAVCQIPGCGHPMSRYPRAGGDLEIHIFMAHHGLNTWSGYYGIQLGVILNNFRTVSLDASSLLCIMPQFLGLKPEIILGKLLHNLFSDLPPEIFDRAGGTLFITCGDDNFNKVVDILSSEMTYRCALCDDSDTTDEGYYGQLPPLEVYSAHMHAVHIRQSHQLENSPC